MAFPHERVVGSHGHGPSQAVAGFHRPAGSQQGPTQIDTCQEVVGAGLDDAGQDHQGPVDLARLQAGDGEIGRQVGVAGAEPVGRREQFSSVVAVATLAGQRRQVAQRPCCRGGPDRGSAKAGFDGILEAAGAGD